MTRDPLTERFKHELREIDPDPKDWFERPDPLHRFSAWGAVALAIAFSAVLVGMVVVGFLWGRWLLQQL